MPCTPAHSFSPADSSRPNASSVSCPPARPILCCTCNRELVIPAAPTTSGSFSRRNKTISRQMFVATCNMNLKRRGTSEPPDGFSSTQQDYLSATNPCCTCNRHGTVGPVETSRLTVICGVEVSPVRARQGGREAYGSSALTHRWPTKAWIERSRGAL